MSESHRLIWDFFAVMSGILLAFTLQAWWEEREEQNDIERVLQSVVVELDQNILAVETGKNHRHAVETITLKTMELCAGGPVEDDFENLLGGLSWYSTPPVSWGALDSLIQSGQLHLIDDIDLRKKLMEISRFRSLFEAGFQEDRENTISSWNEWRRKGVSQMQVAMEPFAREMPGMGFVVYDYDIPQTARIDHSFLLQDNEFCSSLVNKLWLQRDAINRADGYIEDAMSLRASLRAALEV